MTGSEEPVALLPAYATGHTRSREGLTFPELLDRRIASAEAEIAQLEAVLAGVQRKIASLRQVVHQDQRSKELYSSIVFTQPIERLPAPAPRVSKLLSTRVHGTNSAYAQGCRCEDCTRAHRDYARSRRK